VPEAATIALEAPADRDRDIIALEEDLRWRAWWYFEMYDLGNADVRLLRGVAEASIAQETTGVWPTLAPPLLLQAENPNAPVAVIHDLTPFTGRGLGKSGDKYYSGLVVGDDSLSAVVHVH
jgi:hypothetical protein